MALEYEDILKEKLSKLRKLETQLKDLASNKEEVRAQIKKWLELAELREHEVDDTDGYPWKLSISNSSRRSISDWNELALLISEEEWNKLVKVTSTTTFRANRVKVK
ncbi:MAG: hypothetical protein DRG78_15785 [Epsilonproteobacteria bacterium]|nr:MAG: hypothetical protein DRG78_15785 [Campylobacterota bacterium]